MNLQHTLNLRNFLLILGAYGSKILMLVQTKDDKFFFIERARKHKFIEPRNDTLFTLTMKKFPGRRDHMRILKFI